MAELVIRSSSADAFLRCPQYYEYVYELGYNPVDEDPILTYGLGTHDALEARGKGEPLHVQVATLGRRLVDLPWYRQMTATAMIALYNEVYADEDIEYLHVEHPFKVEIADGVVFRGKFDAICRDNDGRLFIMEHKTTRADISDGAPYWLKKEINTQADSYMMAARWLDIDVEYIRYDVLKAPQLKPYKTTPKDKQKFYVRDGKYGKKGDPKPGTRLRPEGSKEFKDRVMEYVSENRDNLLKRVDFERTINDNVRAQHNLFKIAKLIKTGARPQNGASCLIGVRGTECEYRQVCLGNTSLSNTGLFRRNEDPFGY